MLDPIPVRGKAHAGDWAGLPSPAKQLEGSGKNNPRAVNWLSKRYAPTGPIADPMLGVGGGWYRSGREVLGCEIEWTRADLAHRVLGRGASIDVASADVWVPSVPVKLALFSSPFRNSHSSGRTAHQIRIRQLKRIYAIQEFGCSRGNLALLANDLKAYFRLMGRIYRHIHDGYQGLELMVVILRNFYRDRTEVDDICRHIEAMRQAGFEVIGGHPRDLYKPTFFEQPKLNRDPTMPWTKIEWAIVAKKTGRAKESMDGIIKQVRLLQTVDDDTYIRTPVYIDLVDGTRVRAEILDDEAYGPAFNPLRVVVPDPRTSYPLTEEIEDEVERVALVEYWRIRRDRIAQTGLQVHVDAMKEALRWQRKETKA